MSQKGLLHQIRKQKFSMVFQLSKTAEWHLK